MRRLCAIVSDNASSGLDVFLFLFNFFSNIDCAWFTRLNYDQIKYTK